MVNKVILVGNLGSDPELKYTGSGTAVASFNVATSEKWKGQDGEMQEKTEWHKIIVWKKMAETCNEHLKKGSKVYIEGKIQNRKYQNNDGNDVNITEIVAQSVKFL